MAIRLSQLVGGGFFKLKSADYAQEIGRINIGPVDIRSGMTEMGQLNGRFAVMGVFLTNLQNTSAILDWELLADGELITGSAGGRQIPIYGGMGAGAGFAAYQPTTPFEIQTNLTVRATRDAGAADGAANLRIYAIPLE